MRYRRLGASELVVSEIGFGTWTLASDWWGEVADKDALLRTAFDAGITFFDAAPVYGLTELVRPSSRDFSGTTETRSCSQPSAATTSTRRASIPVSRSDRTTGDRTQSGPNAMPHCDG